MEFETYERLNELLELLEECKKDNTKIDVAIDKLGDILGEASDRGI